jgi:hypothetical protein
MGENPPRYQISITPRVGPPIQLRATIPDWIKSSDVVMVAVDDIVPDNEPCESGWTGVMQVFRLQINPVSPSEEGGSMPSASTNQDRP